MSPIHDTLVVGAGVSGLAYAHARGPSADLVVLDAERQAGGLVRTERTGTARQFRYELGPESLRFEIKGGLTDMLAELQLAAHKPPGDAAQRFLVYRAKLHPAPLGPRMITTPMISFAGKLRLLAEPFQDPKVGNDGSVADFVRHRIGREGLAALLDPLVSGIHAGDPEQLSMRACFPRLVELVETHGGLFKALFKTRGDPAPSVMKPEGGCQAVTDALATRLGDKLRLSTSVSALEFDGTTWRVHSSRGVLEARRLVLAVSCQAAARLLATVAPELARAIGSIQSDNVVSYTHVWPRERVGHRLDGFGYLVASREKMNHLGTLFSSSIAPDACPRSHVVLRTLLGGARKSELIDASEGDLAEIVRREVGPMLELRGEPECVVVQRWRATLPRFDLAHPERLRAIERAQPPGLELLGNWLYGIGVNHLVAHARERAHAVARTA
ncbi:MAG: protoporphyrinogen oxidase [Planctomycetes bacterium]|nr:protoporphyrinogen oxidase [Planctomycetota bacterium]